MLFGDGRPDTDLTAHSAPIGNWRFVRSYYLVLLNALKKKLFEEKKTFISPNSEPLSSSGREWISETRNCLMRITYGSHLL